MSTADTCIKADVVNGTIDMRLDSKLGAQFFHEFALEFYKVSKVYIITMGGLDTISGCKTLP
jgi:hypothetical protein